MQVSLLHHKIHSQECLALLKNHSYQNSSGKRFRAIPREIIAGDVVFELVQESEFDGGLRLRDWFQSLRFFSLTVTLMPCLVMFCFSQFYSNSFDALRAVCASASVVFLHLSVNLFNDVEDYMNLIDLPGTYGGSGVLTSGKIRADRLSGLAKVFLMMGILFGLPVLLTYPIQLWWIGALALVGVVGYSGKPFRLKYVALGDLSVFVLLGPLLAMGASVASSGLWNWGTLMLGACFGLYSAALLHANNMQDIFVDTQRGVSTVASLLGFRRSRKLLVGYFALPIVFLVAGIWYNVLPWQTLIAFFASLPFAWAVVTRTYKASGPLSAHLVSIRSKAAIVHFVFSVVTLLALFSANTLW